MTRIVAGSWGGRRLATPAGETTRPTSEKVRAALASSLTAAGGLVGAGVLDLYAGSGALGLELISRGAASAVFVERDRAALVALRANIAALGTPNPRDRGPLAQTTALAESLTVIPGEVSAFVTRIAGGTIAGPPVGPFDVVVADPPYDLPNDTLLAVIGGLHGAGLLRPQADLIIERGVKAGPPKWPAPLEGVRDRKYGDTLLCYGRAP